MGFPFTLAGSLVSGITDAIGSDKAARTKAAAIKNAQKTITQYADKSAGYQQPYYDVGKQNTTTLSNMVNNGSFKTNPYNFQTQQYNDNQQAPTAPGADQYGQQPANYQEQAFNYSQDPGYQFQLQQGKNSIMGGSSAGSGMLSGATQKALAKYGTGVANQSYGDAYNRYNTNRNFDFNNYQTQLGQYNTNRNFAQNDYETQLGQYNTNRNFGANRADAYNQYGMANEQNRYNSANQQADNNFNHRYTLGNMGIGAANNLSDISTGTGNSIAGLIGQAGDVEAQRQQNLWKSIGGNSNSVINYLGGLFG